MAGMIYDKGQALDLLMDSFYNIFENRN